MLIDSSAIIKFFSREPGWEETETYLGESVTLGLAMSELGSGLFKKVSKGEIAKDLAAMLLREYSDKAIILQDRHYIGLAFKYSLTKKVKIYDGLFIAAAFKEGHTLVSCDKEQCDFAESVGVKVIRC